MLGCSKFHLYVYKYRQIRREEDWTTQMQLGLILGKSEVWGLPLSLFSGKYPYPSQFGTL